MNIIRDKRANLFLALSGIFLTNAIIAEIIGVKIFSGEATLGLQPVNIRLFGEFVLDFNLTAGALIWPVVFITTDIINEYFGKEGVQKISLLTAFLILFVFVAIYIVTLLPPADFWIDINSEDSEGNAFNNRFRIQDYLQTRIGHYCGLSYSILNWPATGCLYFPKTSETYWIQNDMVEGDRINTCFSVR